MNCSYCKIDFNVYGLKNHELYCMMNPHRKSREKDNNPMFGRTGANQHTNARRNGGKIGTSSETRKKISESLKGRKMTDHQKLNLSNSMKRAVLNNPSSYSASNVSGRTKTIEYRGFKLKGKWELEVAKWLDYNGIKWTNIISSPFEYLWNGSVHYYFPDFHLYEFDVYLEVKGYERERDREKWKSVKSLIILKKNEIEDIKKRKYNLLCKN